jgi:long-subunit acyl-CoA synthetase (AMP-forming)
MRQVLTLTNIGGSMAAALALMVACQTVATNDAELAASKKEFLLARSGFKTIAVTTPKQQQAVSKLPQGTVSTVKYQGKQYYVYPTATNDKIYVGKQKHLDTYNQAVAAQQTQPGQQNMNPQPTMTFQGHGQHQVVAEEFDGFGPMGVNSLGDW